jgi:hypothetical protein
MIFKTALSLYISISNEANFCRLVMKYFASLTTGMENHKNLNTTLKGRCTDRLNLILNNISLVSIYLSSVLALSVSRFVIYNTRRSPILVLCLHDKKFFLAVVCLSN